MLKVSSLNLNMNGKTPALFLDRDGIINRDRGYLYRYEDIEWMPDIFEIIKTANLLNWPVIVLTNQSGVAQKKYTVEDVERLHMMMDQFLKEKNLLVTDWFYCPELDSFCRKPNPGMLYAARDKHNIDLTQSIMVGDKTSDLFECPENQIGLKTYLVLGNYSLDFNASKRKLHPKTHVEILNNLHEFLIAFKKLLC